MLQQLMGNVIDAVAAMSDLRIESLERMQYFGDVIIKSIPHVDKENLHSYFKKICDVISFQRGMNAVSSVFRLPVKASSTTVSNSSSGIVNALVHHIENFFAIVCN